MLGMMGCQNHPNHTSCFKDNGYQADTVYISGQVLNFPTGNSLRINYTKFIENEYVKLNITPDSLGYFEARIPVINSTRLHLFYFMQGNIINLFAEPGEKIVIHSDWEKKTLAFSGEHARAHQDVYDYQCHVDSLSLSYGDVMDNSISHEEYLQRLTSEWNRADSLLNSYRKIHPAMSERAVAQVQAVNQNEFAYKLMQRRFLFYGRKDEAFPENYVQKADSVFKCFTRPYTLMDVTFLRDYLDYYYDYQGGTYKNMKMIFEYLKANKGIVVTEEQQADIDFINTPEMTKAINEAYEVLIQMPEYEAALIGRWSGGVEMVSMPADLKELMYAYYYYFYLNGSQKAMYNENMQRFHSLVKNADIARPVLELQEKFVELAKQNMEDNLSLKGSEHLKDCKTGEELYHKLLSPYQGKIVYLDVWGTWCSPCKQEMKYTSAIKQAMKGKEMVFLYLANSSPEESWKNVIKEYSLAGAQAVHYNLPSKLQSMLEEYLQVEHYPTYLFIDRNGEIVDRNPPRPSSENELVDYLNECLGN